MENLTDNGRPANSTNDSHPKVQIDDIPISDEALSFDPFLIPAMLMMLIFSLVGTFANLIALHMFFHRKRNVSSNTFIISLAIIDLLTCVLIIPCTIVMEYIDFNIRYDVFCKLYNFLISFNVPLSCFVMVAIAVDRYLCICHSMRNPMNPKRAKIIMICLAIFAAGLGTTTSMTHGVYWLKESNDTAYFNVTRADKVGNVSILSKLASRLSFDCHTDNLTDPIFLTHCQEFSGYDNNTMSSKQDGPRLPQMTSGMIHIQNKQHYENQNSSTDELPSSMNISHFVERTIITYSIVYSGRCNPSEVLLSRRFRYIYQKMYAFLFPLEFCLVFVLYLRIYYFIVTWRMKRQRCLSLRSISTAHRGSPDNAMHETHLLTEMPCASPSSDVVVAAAAAVATASSSSGSMGGAAMFPKERLLMANIRTATMPFVVTIVFILVFLPAWLIAMALIPANKLVYYSYFLYNVVNPFIYAFMNPVFKKERRKMFSFR